MADYQKEYAHRDDDRQFAVGKHHRMLCDTINQRQINVLSGGDDLYLHMGKISFVFFSFPAVT